MICRGLCACTEMLSMCVLYVSFGSKVRPRTIGCPAMGSALLFILRLLYCAGSGVNKAKVVLYGFSVRLLCFVKVNTFCRYVCMYFFGCTRACVYRCGGDVICVCHDLNRCSGWWYGCRSNVE